MLVPAAVLWLLTGLSAMNTMRSAPAFTADLRRESVFEDWRVEERDSLYDPADYYFHLGFGYLRGDAAALMLGETDLPTLEDFEDRVHRSIDLFEASIAASPGHVTAWTNLAWSHFLIDDVPSALAALDTSWDLAPFDVSEARERIGVVGAIQAISGRDLRTEEAHAQSVHNDLDLLSRYDPRYLDALREDGIFVPQISD